MSVMTAVVEPPSGAFAVSKELRVAVRSQGMKTIPLGRFREIFGWWITVDGKGATIRMGNGIVGLSLPASLARQVALSLKASGCVSPVIEFLNEPRRCVFIVDPNDMVDVRGELPHGIEMLLCPRRIALPTAWPGANRAKWLVVPDLSRRWLPTLAAVISAAREVLARRAEAESASHPRAAASAG